MREFMKVLLAGLFASVLLVGSGWLACRLGYYVVLEPILHPFERTAGRWLDAHPYAVPGVLIVLLVGGIVGAFFSRRPQSSRGNRPPCYADARDNCDPNTGGPAD